MVGDYILDFKRPLGQGTFGGVYFGLHSETQEPVAIKIMKKGYSKFSEEEKLNLQRQINFMKDIDHDCAV